MKNTVSISAHLSNLQAKAMLAESMLSTLDACMDDPARHDIALCLVSASKEIAREINKGLDSANLQGLELGEKEADSGDAP